jgi:hypothetical protein
MFKRFFYFLFLISFSLIPFLSHASDSAFQFDGSSVFTIPYSSGFYPSGDFTIDVWVKSLGSSGSEYFSGTYAPTSQGFFTLFGDDASGGVHFNVSISGLHESVVDIRDGNWHRLSFVRSGSVTSIWVDGVDLADSSSLVSLSGLGVNDLYIGQIGNGTPSNQILDDYRFSDIARDPSTYSCYGSDSNTVAMYDFESGSGGSLVDVSGNGHDGVLSGDSIWVSGDGCVGSSTPPVVSALGSFDPYVTIFLGMGFSLITLFSVLFLVWLLCIIIGIPLRRLWESITKLVR